MVIVGLSDIAIVALARFEKSKNFRLAIHVYI